MPFKRWPGRPFGELLVYAGMGARTPTGLEIPTNHDSELLCPGQWPTVSSQRTWMGKCKWSRIESSGNLG